MDERKKMLEKCQNNESTNDIKCFSLDEFVPEIYDCEADGSCGSGHVHVNTRV